VADAPTGEKSPNSEDLDRGQIIQRKQRHIVSFLHLNNNVIFICFYNNYIIYILNYT
jgi:hypothetical protein